MRSVFSAERQRNAVLRADHVNPPKRTIAFGSWGSGRTEIASTVTWLCSDGAPYVTVRHLPPMAAIGPSNDNDGAPALVPGRRAERARRDPARSPGRHVRAAVDHALDLAREEHVGVSEVEGGCVIEPRAGLGGEGQLERREVALELRQLRSPDDGRRDAWPVRQPAQRDLGGAAADA